MEIEFHTSKDDEICAGTKSLSLAVDMIETVARVDDRRDYGETRYIALGLIDGRVYVSVYTMPGDVRRIISLRRANEREIHDYKAAQQG